MDAGLLKFTLILLLSGAVCPSPAGTRTGGNRPPVPCRDSRSSDLRSTDLRSTDLRSTDLRSGGPDLRPRHETRLEVPVAPDVVVVKRRKDGLMKADGVAWRDALARAGALSVRPLFPEHASDGTRLSGIDEVSLQAGADVWKAADAFYRDPSVEWAEPLFERKIHYTPNDPMLGLQWHLDRIKAKEAWDVCRNAKGVVIAIVDNGVDLQRQDLAAGIWTNSDETAGNGLDDDGNGFVDDVHGWDFGDKDNDPKPSTTSTSDNRWHGTGTSSMAAAIADNGTGTAGSSFNATIMPVKVARDSEPEAIYGYNGIVYAADNGADIINCSWGGSGASFNEAEMIAYAVSKGALVTASAGNDDVDRPSYPASLKGVLAVAATDNSDLKASFSNYGYFVDVSAPGEGVYTAWGEGYDWVSGTSFSAPLTAGVAALVKALHPGWSGIQAGEQVRVTAEPIDSSNPDFAVKLGSGRINAYRALTVKSPSVRLDSVRFEEGSPSDGNSLFDPGEEVLLTVTLKNLLESAGGIQVQFFCDDPAVSFANATLSVGSLASQSTWTNGGNPVRVRLGGALERGTKVFLIAKITADGGYTDRDIATLDVSSSFATLKARNARLSVSSIGRLGSADTELNQGEGFVLGGSGNLLFEGGFMAAVSADSVSDVVRGANDVQNRDFRTIPGGEIVIRRDGASGDEQGTAVFTDEAHATSLHLGVAVTAYAFQDSPDANFVLLAYRLYNCWDRPIRNLYAGLFMDWDIEGEQDASGNLAGFDPALDLGYIDEPVSGIHGGLRIFDEGNPINYKLNHNYHEPNFDAEYTETGKWLDLSGGVQDRTVSEQGDYSHVMGIGPVTVDPGDTVLFGYAVLGGMNLDELKAGAAAAETKWRKILTSPAAGPQDPLLPLRSGIEANFPNPFNPETSVGYSIAERGPVRLSVFDMRGREVARLVDAVQEPGRYQAGWDGMDCGTAAPSGVYLCTLRAGSFTKTIKMLLLR